MWYTYVSDINYCIGPVRPLCLPPLVGTIFCIGNALLFTTPY